MALTPLPNTEPPDHNAKVWRYMSFAKFKDILERRALFFPKVSTLRKLDPLEGSVPVREVEFRQRESIRRFNDPLIGTPEFTQMMGNERGTEELHRETFPEMTIVSCWHLREHESKSMWDRYAGGGDKSIAIRSTVGGLQHAFRTFKGDMNLARVGYLDFSRQAWIDGKHYADRGYNFMTAIITKSIEYEDEQELRLTYRHDNWEHQAFWSKQEFCGGLHIPVDLDELIHAVIIAPGSSRRAEKRIKHVIRTVGLSPRLHRSTLDRLPVY